jgi:hypothetical protein
MTPRQRRERLAECERSPVAWELRELARDRAPHTSPLEIRRITHRAPDGNTRRYIERDALTIGAWGLLWQLNNCAAQHNKEHPQWPKTPQQLGRILKRLAPALEEKGLRLKYSRHGKYGRLWTLTVIENDNEE